MYQVTYFRRVTPQLFIVEQSNRFDELTPEIIYDILDSVTDDYKLRY